MNAPAVLHDGYRGDDDGLRGCSVSPRRGQSCRGRTSAAQPPEIAHPMRWASQSIPSELQKSDWSTAAVLSASQVGIVGGGAQVLCGSLAGSCIPGLVPGGLSADRGRKAGA